MSSMVLRPSRVDTPTHIDDTCGIVSILKKVTNEVTFTNIFIGGKGPCSSHVHHCGGVFNGSIFTREGGYATTEVMGWDLVSALNSKSFNQAQEEIQVEGGAKKTQIKSALKKFLKASATSKTLLPTTSKTLDYPREQLASRPKCPSNSGAWTSKPRRQSLSTSVSGVT